MSAKQRISEARTYLAGKIPFLGFLTLHLRPRAARPVENVPTMAVTPDGALIYSEEFIGSLSQQELRGVIAHEVLHPAMHFFARWGNRDLRLFNVAHDFAINLIINDFVSSGRRQSEVVLPDLALLDQKYRNMSAEEIYASFPKMPQQQGQSGQSGQSGQGDQKGQKGQGKGQKGEGGDEKGPTGQGFGGKLAGDCRPDLADTADGQRAMKGDQAAGERLEREWEIRLVSAAQRHEEANGRGSLPAGIKILIDNILEPKVSWGRVLSQWLGEHAGKPDLTYMRPSRRSAAAGEILIGRRRRSYPEVTILWDTSGSMYGEEQQIFGEVASICDDLDLRMRVIIIDAAIQADLEDVKEAAEVAEALGGGGGSDFRPAFERLDEERNDSVVVAFTDGYIAVPETMPECLKGVVWVLTTNGVDPTRGGWGQVLRLDNDKNGKWE